MSSVFMLDCHILTKEALECNYYILLQIEQQVDLFFPRLIRRMFGSQCNGAWTYREGAMLLHSTHLAFAFCFCQLWKLRAVERKAQSTRILTKPADCAEMARHVSVRNRSKLPKVNPGKKSIYSWWKKWDKVKIW